VATSGNPLAITLQVEGLDGMYYAMRRMGSVEILQAALDDASEQVANDVRHNYLTVNRRPDFRGASFVREQALVKIGVRIVQTIGKTSDPAKRRPNYGYRMMKRAFLSAAWWNRAFVWMTVYEAYTEAKALFWESAPVQRFELLFDTEPTTTVVTGESRVG